MSKPIDTSGGASTHISAFGLRTVAQEVCVQATRLYMRYCPVSAGKHRLLRLLANPLAQIGGYRETTLKSTSVRIGCDLRRYLQRQLYFLGEYEREETRLWLDEVPRAGVVFDLGANVGLYTLLAAVANPEAAIHAFEPSSSEFAALQVNVRMNAFKNVTLVPSAVSARTGTAYLNDCSGDSQDNEGMDYLTDDAGCSGSPVAAVSLDEYCRQHAIDGIDLMKVDVEGAEYDVFLGARSLLSEGKIRMVIVELSDWALARAGHTPQEVVQVLSAAGFELHRIGRNGVRALESELHNCNILARLPARPEGV